MLWRPPSPGRRRSSHTRHSGKFFTVLAKCSRGPASEAFSGEHFRLGRPRPGVSANIIARRRLLRPRRHNILSGPACGRAPGAWRKSASESGAGARRISASECRAPERTPRRRPRPPTLKAARKRKVPARLGPAPAREDARGVRYRSMSRRSRAAHQPRRRPAAAPGALAGFALAIFVHSCANSKSLTAKSKNRRIPSTSPISRKRPAAFA